MSPLVKKLLLIISSVLFFFLIVRPLRGIVHDAHLGTIFPKEYGEINEYVAFKAQSSTSFTFITKTKKGTNEWLYKIQFGLFFLLSLIGLLIVNSEPKFYGFLVLIHIIAGIISFLFITIVLLGFTYLLIIPDLLARYLVPLCSLGLVALSHIQIKQEFKK